MASSSSGNLRIIERKATSLLSNAQKTFNRLSKKIAKQREQLGAWNKTIPLYQEKYVREFDPLLQSFDEYRVQLVHIFDRLYSDKIFSKTDRSKLQHLICAMVVDLLDSGDHVELKEIYNRHSGSDYDAEEEQDNQEIKSMMESMLGVELGDDIDMRTPDDFIEQVSRQLHEKLHQDAQDQEHQAPSHSSRKKSAKAMAKEARLQAEAQQVSQSIREVFRKLASTLHPDKEHDPKERARKTELMQRVNSAYSNNDLLALLELQLEIEQIDQAAINAISEDRLKHYNKVLKEQSAELQQELEMVEMSFRAHFDFPPYGALSPTMAFTMLERDIATIRQDIAGLKEDVELLQDAKNLKKWLKAYKIVRRPAFELDPFFEMP
ncbi:J domain-containing protein [Noviherbaspirillum malthae]|uniref:J domain-containing protein n=1 Tax=Noviherbaspirillum malthae TaxID=1260987 RepID=UPI0018905B19|nr:J domain-containing protein [Noviherbaspirillum malthae]